VSAGTKSEAGENEPISGTIAKDKRAATYTVNAREGFNAAEVVNAAFGKRAIGSTTPRKLEVVEPDGPSTAGGKRARQTIRLVALHGNAAPLMCGTLDASQRAVELRSYATVRAQFEERFNQALDISADDYARLCKDLQATLTVFRYTFTVEDAEANETRAQLTRAAGESVAPSARRPLLNVVLLGAVALVIAGVALAMMLR
jgi:translation initiation factor IF-2